MLLNVIVNEVTRRYLPPCTPTAIIAVNEEGTEASAVTSVLTCPARRRRSNPIDFFANKPFLYVIRERNTGTIMFMGALKTPEEASTRCRDCPEDRERGEFEQFLAVCCKTTEGNKARTSFSQGGK